MTNNKRFLKSLFVVIVFVGSLALIPLKTEAHCDALDGPVVTEARKALEQKEVTPVLKWVQKEYENEIRAVFQKTLTVRVKGPEAKELADNYFFETLIRLHRAGEGAPYSGLKPAGTVEPVVAASDRALATGKVDELSKEIANKAEEGIRKRFQQVLEKKKHANDSASAGREYVEAYVEYVHYVEQIHILISETAHGDEGVVKTKPHQH
jgi:hypothetical protein